MAMNALSLGNELKAVFVAAGAADNAATASLCTGLAQKIIDHITNNAVVIPLTAPDPDAMMAGANPVTGKARVE